MAKVTFVTEVAEFLFATSATSASFATYCFLNFRLLRLNTIIAEFFGDFSLIFAVNELFGENQRCSGVFCMYFHLYNVFLPAICTHSIALV